MSWKHYVALGDSLTFGTGDDVEGMARRSWADWFAERLGVAKLTNLAQPGKTSDELITEQLPAALQSGADIFTLLIGGNDIRQPLWTPSAFRDNYTLIVEKLLATDARVLTMTMIDNSPALPETYRQRARTLYERLHEVNDIVRNVSQRYSVVLIDLQDNPLLQAADNFSTDLIHANMRGYQRIGLVVAEAFGV